MRTPLNVDCGSRCLGIFSTTCIEACVQMSSLQLWLRVFALSQEHKDCASSYNTQLYAELRNSSLPEQKNALLRRLEAVLPNMTQCNTMYFMRWILAEQNKEQEDKNTGVCWY
jgi:hypothetical protein